MKTAALALALLLGSPQEGVEKQVNDLVARLADDAIDARDLAVRGLAELGPAAIPILRKIMAKMEGEGRGRVEEAIRAIERRDTLSRSLPPLKRITLDHRNRPAQEAVEEIARQTGLPVHFQGDPPKGAITLTLKDATPLEAFDAVCRKDGQLSFRVDPEGSFRRGGPRPPARIVFSAAPFVAFPAAFVRHYRVSVTELSLTRTNTFRGTQASGSVSVNLHWLPDTRPKSLRKFEVTEIKDDRGRSLLPEKKDGEETFPGTTRFGQEDLGCSTDESVEIKYPEADAVKIATLKGSFVFSYPKETKTLSFEKPADMKGRSLDLHGLKITLEDYKEQAQEISIKIVVSGKYAGPKDPAKEGVDEDLPEARFPFSYDDIEALSEGGEPLDSSSMSSGGSDDHYRFTLTYRTPKPQSLKEIRIPCVLAYHIDKVEFEIKDIAFPK